MALAGKCERRKYRVYVMLGDGELQEGSNYEALMCAAKYKLDNLIAVIDRNMIQTDYTEKLMPMGVIQERFAPFGWSVRVIDGNDMGDVVGCLQEVPFEENKPNLIVANTIKGKGVEFIENTPRAHITTFSRDEMKRALSQLKEAYHHR